MMTTQAGANDYHATVKTPESSLSRPAQEGCPKCGMRLTFMDPLDQERYCICGWRENRRLASIAPDHPAKLCAWCGVEFIPRHKAERYCPSGVCRAERKAEQMKAWARKVKASQAPLPGNESGAKQALSKARSLKWTTNAVAT